MKLINALKRIWSWIFCLEEPVAPKSYFTRAPAGPNQATIPTEYFPAVPPKPATSGGASHRETTVIPGRSGSATAARTPKARVIARLVGVNSDTVHNILQTDDVVLVGRSTRCDLTLADPGVSSLHASILVNTPTDLALRDLNSANGCTVNGQPIGAETVSLKSGDLIAFSNATFKLHYQA